MFCDECYISEQVIQYESVKLHLQTLLVTNRRENYSGCSWKRGVSNLSMLKPLCTSIYSWHTLQVSNWRLVRGHTWMEYSRAGLNLGPKRLWFECSKQPLLHTHSRWAFKSEQTVEVFRKAERVTLKGCVTFSLRHFFFMRASEERGGEELGWEFHWDMTFLILSVWTQQGSGRKRVKRRVGFWKDARRC